MGLLLDLFEIFRKTKSDVKSNKPQPRRYDFDAGFTGDKKSDSASVQPIKKTTAKKEKDSSEREER